LIRMATRRQQDFTKKVNEHLIELAEKGAAVGDKQFVRFPKAMQIEYDIAPFGTLSYEKCKKTGELEEVYVAGPPEYRTDEKPMHYGIPDLNSWLEDYKSGREPASLASFVPDHIDAHLNSSSSLPSLTTQSFFESWFFSKVNQVIMVNPATGSIYRALEEKSCIVRIYLTFSEIDWKRPLEKRFSAQIKSGRVVFIDRDEFGDDYVYHGSNGFRADCLCDRSFCLEPNPYSCDIRKGQISVKSEPDGIRMNYERKDQIREYFFVHRPDYFRVDPLTLFLNTAVRGDSFFFSSQFDPAICMIGTDQSIPTVLAMGCHLSSYPRGQWQKIGSYECLVDSSVLYDIKTSGTYISRYHKMKEICPEGMTVVQMLEGYGRVFVHPYAYSPRVTSFSRYRDSWILEDYTAYNTPCPEECAPSVNGIVFRVNDFEGSKQTPLEAIGTYYPCPTFVSGSDSRRYFRPDGSLSYYFSSKRSFVEWMCFIAHNEIGGVVPLIEIENKQKRVPVPEYTPPETADVGLNWTSDLISLASDGVSLSSLLLQFRDQPVKTVMRHLLHTCSVLLDEDSRFYSEPYEYSFVDDDCEGLSGIVCQAELKRELLSAISFEDPIENDVSDRIHDALSWKFLVTSVETGEDTVVRTFRKDPEWY